MTTATLIKGNIELGLTYGFRGLSSWQEAWYRLGRHGSGEGTESSTSGSAGRRTVSHLAYVRPQSRPHSDTLPPTKPHPLQ